MTDTAARTHDRGGHSALAASFNPFDEEYLQDPYTVFAQARQKEPVFYSPEIDYWVVSRYDDVMQVLKDPKTFSATAAVEMIKPPCDAALAVLAEVDFIPQPFLVDEDGPLHAQRRRVLRRGVTQTRVDELEPYARRFTTECLDAIVARGEGDLVDDLTFSVPSLTAFILMGVPEAEVRRIREYASRFALWIWGRPSDEQQVVLAKEFADYLVYVRGHIDRLIEKPGDDYMSNAIRAWQEMGTDEVWNRTYLASVMQGHMYASHETTTNATASGFKALLENRDQWEAICADPSLIPNAVEEILRYQSSVPAWRRVTTAPTELGGHRLPEGARVLILTGSANHDEAVFENGEVFDITRPNANQHLAFGWGTHECLGQPLAKMEMRVMLEEVSRRLPHLHLVPEQEWSYSANTSFRGPNHVRVSWDPRRNPLTADRP